MRSAGPSRLPYTIVRPFNCVGVGEGRALGDVEITSGNVKLAMSHVVPDLVQKVRGIVTCMTHPAAFNAGVAVLHRPQGGGTMVWMITPDTVRPELAWPPAADACLRGKVVEVTRLVPERDADALYQALDDDEVWQHLAGRPATPQEHARLLTRRLAEGRVVWLVRLVRPYRGLPAGAVAGTSSYLSVSTPDARLEIGATAYRRQLWATAVNPETKLLLLGYAFGTLAAARVQLVTDGRNARSRRAIERLGATQEGILRSYQRRADGTLRDTVVFSILRHEWPQVRAGLHARLGVT